MPFVRRLCLALLLGFGVSVATAWAFAVLSPPMTLWRQQFVMDLAPLTGDDLVGIDPIVPTMCVADARGSRALSCVGGRFTSPRFVTDADGTAPLSEPADWRDATACNLAEARGWPLLCLWHAERDRPSKVTGGFVLGPRPGPSPGIQSTSIVLPYRPLPLGLALNTLIYGAVILSSLQFRAWARARRRRGGCLRCGYSLAGIADNANCPECGAERS